MKPENNPQDKQPTFFAKPKDGESREEFTKRVIKLLRERGLITEKSSEPSDEETDKGVRQRNDAWKLPPQILPAPR